MNPGNCSQDYNRRLIISNTKENKERKLITAGKEAVWCTDIISDNAIVITNS